MLKIQVLIKLLVSDLLNAINLKKIKADKYYKAEMYI